jgi:hypothetical protein
MTEEELYKKWYKHKEHDYELTESMEVYDDKGRNPDILFVYSGRNRGKSFEIAMRCITDAYYHGRQFAYCRRYDAKIIDIERYFDDKIELIKDMTDGSRDGVAVSKGDIFLYHTAPDLKGGGRRVLDEKLGSFFAVSRQSSYKSLQYPDIYNQLVEEVLTDEESYLPNETDKILNLRSTLERNKVGFKTYLISNTVSVVNPYSKAWNLNFAQSKPDEIRLNKLYLGSYDENGNEKYYLIASHYLKNKDELTKEDQKKHEKNRVKTGISSNKWDEARLYHHVNYRFMKSYKPVQTVIFEWDDLKFMGDIVKVPENILDMFLEDEEPAHNYIYVLYISRKSTRPQKKTRIYTNNPDRLNALTTRGFRLCYKIDEVIQDIINRGWVIGTDNLCMNDFMKIFQNLRLIIK